jgi:hypothetical protein
VDQRGRGHRGSGEAQEIGQSHHELVLSLSRVAEFIAAISLSPAHEFAEGAGVLFNSAGVKR